MTIGKAMPIRRQQNLQANYFSVVIVGKPRHTRPESRLHVLVSTEQTDDGRLFGVVALNGGFSGALRAPFAACYLGRAKVRGSNQASTRVREYADFSLPVIGFSTLKSRF